MLDLGIPALLSANRHFHKLLVGGVPVEYQKEGETRGDFVRLIDWKNPAKNRWLAVNQFSIKGLHHTRRPDVILFVNGLPLVLLELKNPADEKADIWKAYDQIQTYKEQIPDVFQYNELLVISDGSEARLGSLSSNTERFMQWRTIDGLTLDPLGQFNELETMIRGVLAPTQLLDYLRFFVLFEDGGDQPGGGCFASRRGCCQTPQGRRRLAYAGQRQEHHDDLLCSAGHAGIGDGEPDHRRDHRPQRP